MKKIASVVLSSSTREFDKEYHYEIPENMIEAVKPGIRVIVPFGRSNKSVEAYVFAVIDEADFENLKPLKKVIDESEIINENMIKLCRWMKQRYICTYSDVIKSVLPPGIGVESTRIIRLLKPVHALKGAAAKLVEIIHETGDECEYDELKRKCGIKDFSKRLKLLEEQGIVSVFEEYSTRVKEKTVRVAYICRPREEIIDEIESNRIKRIQQIRILEMLLDNEFISVSDLVRFASVSPGVLDTLKKYGYIDFKQVEVTRDPYANRLITKTSPLVPTPEQSTILRHVAELIENNSFGEVLVHGVTGSGKTEVYLQLIQKCFDMGKRAIVLVPEISLTPQMVERFKGRFGDDVAVLHSRLSLGERFDQWRLIRDGKIKVVVGARSAVFAPFEKLGMIIIDEEHENTYKSETTPKYHARDVARFRCMLENAVLLYGSATPSVETYFKAQDGQIGLLKMVERANSMVLPEVELVDMRNELNDGNRSIFSKRLAEEIKINMDRKEQTILFLNRRGYSSFVLCRNCGYTMRCSNCNISLTYHSNDERLICHYCGYTIKNPELCPKCKSNYIRHFGVGTQRVEEDLKKQFPDCSAVRMDMDTTTYKNSHEEILKAFREQNINVMVGTQMIAKGHDFPNVTLVGVLAADSLLNTEDYRASERTFQLITQVAGRAGRGELPGRVIIQTYNTEDFSILAACRHDFSRFYSQEIKLREKLEYPPYTNIGVIILSGTMDRNVFDKAREVWNSIVQNPDYVHEQINIYGPSRSPLSKIKNKYRWRIVLKCKCINKLIRLLELVSDSFYKKRNANTVELSVDINPVNML